MLSSDLEGLGWYTYEIVKSWLNHHKENQYTLIFDRPCHAFTNLEAQRVILGPATTHTPSITWWNEISVSRWLNKNRPDIYFSPDGFIPLRTSIRCVPVVHDIAPLIFPQFMRTRDYLYYRFFQRRMILHSWKIFTVSEFSKNEITKSLSIEGSKILVAYNGLHSGFKDLSRTEKEQSKMHLPESYFFYYGSIHPRKNVIGLIKSFEIYRSNGGQAKLIIAGRRAWKADAVEQAIRDSHSSSSILRFEYLTSSELFGILRKAISLVYISHYEGFGLPVLEAMAMGVPVITTSNSSMAEIGGKAVLTAIATNHEQVAHWMNVVETDEPMRQQLIKKGKLQSQKFNYDQTASYILKKLKEK